MEFYQRVKQKLADEIEGDSPLEYPEGNGSNDVESLKQEIEELKHHLNSNYTVYTRRLEKSKAKRKDLEACLREVTTENERLAREADQAEVYRGKLEEYREQLEQLESYQSQELAKVKHMLLSAESELEAEKKKSPILPIQNDSSEVSNKDDSIDDEAIARLKQENQVLQSKLVDVMSERDTMKANLLEVEIANHECDQAKVNEIDAFKIEIAKLQAEIETLNVTLKVRDGEIKAKKEDLKKEKENHTSTLQTVDAANIKLSNLEAEIESLKYTLSERLMQLREAQKLGDQLEEKVESLQGSVNNKEKTLSEISYHNEELSRSFSTMSEEKTRLLSVIDGLNAECNHQREQISTLTDTAKKQVEALKALEDDNSVIKAELNQLEESIPSLIQSSDLVKSLEEKRSQLEDDLEEKKQAVRHLQLRSNEMKKMLQKEMKSGAGDSINPGVNGQESPRNATPTFSLPTLPNGRESSPRPTLSPTVSLPENSDPTSSVTLAYMRHVILKFLTSPEVESKQMTRALAVILQFTKEEEKRLQAYLDWKMSWFGPKPKLLH